MCKIEFKNVSFAFENKKILDNISFEINQGEFISLIGQNGSGKSVLGRHINGLLTPTSGDVFVDGMNTKDDSKIYDIRQKVGFIFQDPDNQIVSGTVEEDVAFGLSNLGTERSVMRKRVDDILKQLNIYEYKDFEVNKLSGGIKQKLILSGILVMNVKCLVLDEPTSMLDSANRKIIIDELMFLNKEKNITIILLTHHIDEAKLADKIFLLESGKIIQGDRNLIETRFFKKNKMNIEFLKNESQNDEVILECKNLSFRYEKKSDYIFKNLNLKIKENDILEIIGSNGSGKSTFVSVLKGILPVTSGEIFLNGKKASKKELNRSIGIVFQIPDYQLFEDTVLQEVVFGTQNMGFTKEESKNRAIQALKMVGIDEQYFDYSPFDLSGGMKKLVSIASVLSMDPKILIFDEPVACLDFLASKRIIELIIDLNIKHGKTIILIHHTLDRTGILINKNFINSSIKFPVN